MQITEIRWAAGHQEHLPQRLRLPVGPGITLVDGRSAQSESLFARLQADLVLEPDGLTGPKGSGDFRYWQFILEEGDRRYSFSTDQAIEGRGSFFRRAILGRESEILGASLDYAFLADASRSSEEKKELMGQLLARLETSRSQVYDPALGRGRLTLLRQDLAECGQEIDRLGKQAISPRELLEKVTEGEGRLGALKIEDGRLAQEQRKQKYLAIRDEYETLIRLEGELEETKEREGAFGSRITGLGHNITVHELTELARMRNQVQELEAELEEEAKALEAVRQERMKTEQQRAFLRRRLNELEKEKAARPQPLNLIAPTDPEGGLPEAEPAPSRAREEGGRESFPSPKQLAGLVFLLLFAAGLFLSLYVSLPGLLVSGAALLGAAGLGLHHLILKNRTGLDLPASQEESVGAILGQTSFDQLEAQIGEAGVELDLILSRIAELDQKEAGLATACENGGRRFRRAENDLLRRLRQYAGPSEMTEVDAIIETLSRQRDSSAYYNETLANLTRQIAELKHGRSDREMKREYDRASARLSSDPASSPEALALPVGELVYEPVRLQQITAERTELAGRIDLLAGEISEHKRRLSQSREAAVSLGSLEQRRKVLLQSLRDAEDEYERAGTAAAWLEELLNSWDGLDPGAWMEKSVGYLHRLMGRRPAGAGLAGEVGGKGRGLRAPRVAGGQASPKAAEILAMSFFMDAPPSLRYLAARLALSQFQGQEEGRGGPLLLIEPALMAGSSPREHLLNALEEWTLETGRQVVYFTEDESLIGLAQARKMNLYGMA